MLARSVTAVTSGGLRSITRIPSNINENSYCVQLRVMSQDRFKLPERYAGQGESVWNIIGAVVAKYQPLNLGQGFPNFAAPSIVTKTLSDVALEKNHLLHQYTRGFGHVRLINAVAKVYGKLTNKTINPMTEVLITCGAYEALYCAICGHVNHCDEVIVIEPYFDCYEPMIKSAGGVPQFIALKPCGDSGDAGNWRLDEEELEALFNENTKVIIVNTPSNPLGKVFSRKELEKIAELCIKWNVLCISDEVYEWLIYEGYEHVRICTLPGMWDRTITIGSAGKTFHVTGWKTGWAYGPENLIKNLFIVHQNCIYTMVTPIQETIARCFESVIPTLDRPDCMLKDIVKILTPKRKLMEKILLDVGMKPVIPQGGYFMLTDWSALEDQCDLSEHDDEFKDFRFAKWMAEHIGVQGIPPSAFYSREHKHLAENYLRICFIKTDEFLLEAEKIMQKWKSKQSECK